MPSRCGYLRLRQGYGFGVSGVTSNSASKGVTGDRGTTSIEFRACAFRRTGSMKLDIELLFLLMFQPLIEDPLDIEFLINFNMSIN